MNSLFRATLLALLLLVCALPRVVHAQIHISGELSGTLVDTTYIVDDDISVSNGNTLYIDPGAILYFTDSTSFRIHNATLIAEGTISDSINFIPYDTTTSWNGIDIVGYHNSSIFSFCNINGSVSNGIEAYECYLPKVSNSSITNCIGTTSHGLYYSSSISDDSHVLSTNIAYNSSNGIFVSHIDSTIQINNCHIHHNSDYGILVIFSSDILIDSSSISYNGNNNTFGGGINIWYSECRIYNNLITYNSSNSNGAAIQIGNAGYANAVVANNTICNNYTPGFVIYFYGLVMFYNNITDNQSNGMLNNLSFMPEQPSIFSNSFNNDSINYYDIYNTFDSISIVIDTNINGDSCDIYNNIFCDPILVDSITFLLDRQSPCIDAGSNIRGLDPDGTLPDLGYIYYDNNESINKYNDTNTHNSYNIITYPNPTNNIINISMILPNLNNLVFSIYNINGQLLDKTLIIPNSLYESVSYNINNYSSGIYLLRICHGNEIVDVSKIIVIK